MKMTWPFSLACRAREKPRCREPEIYETTRRFGSILENATMDMRTRHVDPDDASLTENTRAAYPITHIPNMTRSGKAGHPKHIIMLTRDAFGVLPPVTRLTPAQAMYRFLAGYTAKSGSAGRNDESAKHME